MDDYPYFGCSFSGNDAADARLSKPAKRLNVLSLKKKRAKENDPMNESTRFEEAFPVVSEDQYNQLPKGFIAKKYWKVYQLGY